MRLTLVDIVLLFVYHVATSLGPRPHPYPRV